MMWWDVPTQIVRQKKWTNSSFLFKALFILIVPISPYFTIAKLLSKSRPSVMFILSTATTIMCLDPCYTWNVILNVIFFKEDFPDYWVQSILYPTIIVFLTRTFFKKNNLLHYCIITTHLAHGECLKNMCSIINVTIIEQMNESSSSLTANGF